jgi:outer membrane protein
LLVCSLPAFQPALFSQTTRGDQLPSATKSEGLTDAEPGRLGRYRGSEARGVKLYDTTRIDSLIRAGTLYLSLRDAIALAIENNLDVEYQRLTPLIGESDLMRTRAGGISRGVPSNILQGPSGLGSSAVGSGAATAGISGAATQTDLTNQLTSGTSVPAAGPQTSASGPAIPALDPAIVGAAGWNRSNRPQTNTFITGTNAIIGSSTVGELGVRKGFLFGGTGSLGFDGTRQNTNNLRSDINPSTSGGLSFSFTQPLLQGFGSAVNGRYIRIAKNNRRVSDLVFEQQLLTTVYSVIRLYWDLVALTGEVRVQRESLSLSERLLNENRQQQEAGTLAPIDVVRTRASVASVRRDLTVAETRVRQQETILKDYLTRGTVDSTLFNALRIVPTDSVGDPPTDPIQPIQDLVAEARSHRPDLLQVSLQVDNSKIALTGSRNALLPNVDLVVNARSNALYGTLNPTPPPGSGTGGTDLIRTPDPSFLGGAGTGLSQIFGAQFADYGAQIQVNIPILNRAARADYARDRIAVSQQQIRLQQLEKQIRVDVVNALIAVEQSRAAWTAAKEARDFQAQSLEAEREKYKVGVSTNYLLIQYQRDLVQAESAEVTALTDYAKARAALDRATGALLDKMGISIVDAYRGSLPVSPRP